MGRLKFDNLHRKLDNDSIAGQHVVHLSNENGIVHSNLFSVNTIANTSLAQDKIDTWKLNNPVRFNEIPSNLMHNSNNNTIQEGCQFNE